jgi:RimJ/RimL family protein N-acetyltransferase
MIKIREIVVSDADKLLELHRKLDNESKFMLYEPNERKTSIEQQKGIITTYMNSDNSNIFVVEEDSQLVGHLSVNGGNTNRIRHRAYIVIGIMKEYTNNGIGKELFRSLEEWRFTTKITRLELTVMTNNEQAIKLYKREGFEIEGIRKNSMIIEGKYIDEYNMAKIF